MELSAVERAVLGCVQEKCWIAGSTVPGYLLRVQAIAAMLAAQAQVAGKPAGAQEAETDAGLRGLVEKGLLAPLGSAGRVYLTAAGADFLAAHPGRVG